ncbi:aspartate carbamoyltransferase catalytic subunit [Microaerobacter geothermalis]|uniref:aspartate carbamoyltransferase catalytic subunit n=1 Tax=Microaerobacter geothermalis TaxID=674972 RepID=UPI001F1B1A88|nr:aspartate carbamoyltransferase catalytic subunit [Microaerobacter geothermalis]MCF6094762.1 aspartate carbamoyltransferase catalytic subunit [Microaerobacter geothermalis]
MKHLLGIKGLDTWEVEEILERAAYWANRPAERSQALSGTFVANLFFEPSTRTRLSFEVAEKRLGADVLQFRAETASTQKGETLYDTLRTLESMGVEIAVIRHPESYILEPLAKQVKISLINAGDGWNEHPTQCLLDLLTIKQHFGQFEGLKVAIIGDILHSRVARSHLSIMPQLGISLVFSGPDHLMLEEKEFHHKARVVDMDEAVTQSDVVMMLRVQRERHHGGLILTPQDYHFSYGLTEKRARQMKKGAVIMHPAPVNRDVEIASSLVECEKSLIQKQVANGVAVRMAVLERCKQGGSKGWAFSSKTLMC